MIDQIKILSLPITIYNLKANPFLTFRPDAHGKDGVSHAGYRNMFFSVNESENRRKVIGSLHKYYNEGIHNHDDFIYPSLCFAIHDFSTRFNVDPGKAFLNSLEYGINLMTPFNPDEVFPNLIQHGGVAFSRIKRGRGRECIHSQYRIKIYNKGHQYKLGYQVLRVEISVNAMEYLQSRNIPIRTLSDLMVIDNLILLRDDLLKQFRFIWFYDSTIDKTSLSLKEQLLISEIRREDFWDEPHTKNAKDALRRKYSKFFKAHVRIDWKKIIGQMIEEKFETLLSQFVHSKKKWTSFLIPGTISITKNSIIASDGDNPVIITALTGNSGNDKISDSDFLKKEIVNGQGTYFDASRGRVPGFDLQHDSGLREWKDQVDSLLKFFDKAELPKGRVFLNPWTTITDCSLFVESSIETVRSNIGKQTYSPYLNRLQELRDLLSGHSSSEGDFW